ncbi:MAG: hypothetical protein WC082_07990 [Victivallales bacterium]
MYSMPIGYRAALLGDVEKIEAFIAIGTNIDQTAADDITSIDGDFLPMSNVDQLTDANYEMTEWMATFEGDGIKTAVDSGMIAPPISATDYPPQVGIWSECVADSVGDVDFTITINLNSEHTSGFTIYSYDQNILTASIVYYLDNEIVRTADMVASVGKIQDADGATYNKIVLNVTNIDRPNCHVKIAELEFGASETYGGARLAGEINLIQEWDPTMQAIPLYELDFSLLNVLGEFDVDNPNGYYDKIIQNYPVELSFSITADDGTKYTVPCGKFMISSKTANDTTLDIVAFDARSALSDNYRGLTLSTTQSFGDLFTALFDGLNVPHSIDDDLFSEYPDQNITFSGDDYDLLTAIQYIEQYYDIWLIPEKTGRISVTETVPSDDYGEIDSTTMSSYPSADIISTFNYISIAYGDTEYVLDLRTDPAQLRSEIAINNPLISTLEKAMALAVKIQSAIFSSQIEVNWRGDPALDVTDYTDVAGKWSAGSALQYRCLYQELTYDGGMSAKTKMYR